MHKVLVIDDMVLFREPLAGALQRQGFEARCAGSARATLEAVRTWSPDLLVLEIGLPDVDGLELLERLHREHGGSCPPAIVLTASADRESVLRAARLGVRDYVLKTQFALDDLLDRARRLISESARADAASNGVDGDTDRKEAVPRLAPADARSLEPLMRRSQLNLRLDDLGELETVSITMSRVLKLTQSRHCSIDQVARAILQDPAISLKVLRMANSAVYNRGEPVDSLDTALIRLGLAQIRQLMLNIAVIERFDSSRVTGPIEWGPFWEHAIATGIIAAEIACARRAAQTDVAFTEGLLHDVGRLILAERFPEEFATAVRTARAMDLPLEVVEERLLLVDHAEVMNRLLHAWAFPKELVDPIVLHHETPAGIRRLAPQRVDDVAVVVLANRLAHALLLGSSGNDTIYPTETLCGSLGLDEAFIDRVVETTGAQVTSLRFALLLDGDAPAWTDRRQRLRDALARPMRPLFVSESPGLDAYRLFFEQISDTSCEAPSVGIIHLTSPRQRSTLSRALLEAEAGAGAANLPLLLLSPNGELEVDDALMRGRRIELLTTPVTTRRLLAALDALTAADVAAVPS